MSSAGSPRKNSLIALLMAFFSSYTDRMGLWTIPIWPGVLPDAQPVAGRRSLRRQGRRTRLLAGKPYLYVERVSQPTMTVYSPKNNNTGVVVIVFPGGGYEGLGHRSRRYGGL